MESCTRPTIDIVTIVRAGCSVRLNMATRPTIDLVTIARAAKESGTRVTFTGMMTRPTIDLTTIGHAAVGAVTIEG